MGSDLELDVSVSLVVISIHAPRVGSDDDSDSIFPSIAISIHAPRVGSDPNALEIALTLNDFNPRSPCGERLHNDFASCKDESISIHAPRVGSDVTRRDSLKKRRIFQSTLPVWGAT